MQLGLPEDSLPVQEMFERFFATESTSARVRAAEPVGFDRELWTELLGLEAPFLRLSSEAGGGEMSLFDACLMMEQAGRRLAEAARMGFAAAIVPTNTPAVDGITLLRARTIGHALELVGLAELTTTALATTGTLRRISA